MSFSEKMTAIADNIRNKTGNTEKLTLDDMESSIEDIFDAGKKAQYDVFWDKFQKNGTKTDYTNAFSYTHWSNEIFKPKYQMKPKIAQAMFYRNTVLSGEIESIINIDWSNCANFKQACQDLNGVTRLGVLDLRKATDLTNAFIYMSSLTTIDKIIIKDGVPYLGFTQNTALQNVTFEGVIASNISASQSPLSVESIKSIISCLKNYNQTSSEYTFTVTFLTSAFAVLESEGKTAEYNGVACTWAELIDNKKWNLTLA